MIGYFRCLLFCGTEWNTQYLFYGTPQKQAKTASHLRIIGYRIPSKYNTIIP